MEYSVDDESLMCRSTNCDLSSFNDLDIDPYTYSLIRCVLASLYEGMFVRPSVGDAFVTGKSMILIANNDVS